MQDCASGDDEDPVRAIADNGVVHLSRDGTTPAIPLHLRASDPLLDENSSILSEVTRRSSPDKTGGNRIAASVRIEAFEGSRWRLRRTRLVCVLNGVLVLRYCILTGIPPCRW